MTEDEHRPGAAAGEAAGDAAAGAGAGREMPPADPPLVQFMKGVVIALGVLLVVGVIGLVAMLMMKGGDGGGRAARPVDIAGELPRGGNVAQLMLDGRRLAVGVALPGGGAEILVFDLREGRLQARVRLRRPAGGAKAPR